MSGAGSPKVLKVSKGTRQTQWMFKVERSMYSILFQHNTTTGGRMLHINGVQVYKARVRYKLTGVIVFDIGDNELNIHIDHDSKMRRKKGESGYSYTLLLNGERIPTLGERKPSDFVRWEINVRGTYDVEFEPTTGTVSIDGREIRSLADFATDEDEAMFVAAEEKAAEWRAKPRSEGKVAGDDDEHKGREVRGLAPHEIHESTGGGGSGGVHRFKIHGVYCLIRVTLTGITRKPHADLYVDSEIQKPLPSGDPSTVAVRVVSEDTEEPSRWRRFFGSKKK